jgi:endonuclease/exonuclease/phosphatase family metal-dependent hydrolase
LRWTALVVSVGYLVGLILHLLLRLLLGDRFWWLGFLNTFAPIWFLPLAILTPLLGLMRSRWVWLALALLLVTLLWFGPYFLPKLPPVTSTAALKIVTFNIWGDNRTLTQAEDWLRQTDADLILLQEIPARYAQRGVDGLRADYPHQAVQAWGWGQLTLSKHPILEAKDIAPPSGFVFQRVVISVNNQPIAIYNMHLSMPMRERPRASIVRAPFFVNMAFSYDDATRNAEIAFLLKMLENEPLPFIVAGDFNTSDQSVSYAMLGDKLGDSYREAGVGFGATWPRPVAAELPAWLPPVIRIDYIFHSPHFAAIESSVGPSLGSDHLPTVSRLALNAQLPSPSRTARLLQH